MPELLAIFLLLTFNIPFVLTGLMILSIDLLTEQGPAISLSYELPEAAIMRVPPRNLQRDKLISGNLLRYSYIWASAVMISVCLSAFFVCFAVQGKRRAAQHDAPTGCRTQPTVLTSHAAWSAGVPGSAVIYSSPTDSPDLVVNGRVLTGVEQERIYRSAVAA